MKAGVSVTGANATVDRLSVRRVVSTVDAGVADSSADAGPRSPLLFTARTLKK